MTLRALGTCPYASQCQTPCPFLQSPVKFPNVDAILYLPMVHRRGDVIPYTHFAHMDRFGLCFTFLLSYIASLCGSDCRFSLLVSPPLLPRALLRFPPWAHFARAEDLHQSER